MTIHISFYQIVLGMIALLFIANSLIKFVKKEKGQTFFKFLATIVIWGSIFAFAIFPNIAHALSKKLGLGDNFNTLIFIGFVIIFIIIFKLLSIVERLEQSISEIVRKEALNKLENK